MNELFQYMYICDFGSSQESIEKEIDRMREIDCKIERIYGKQFIVDEYKYSGKVRGSGRLWRLIEDDIVNLYKKQELPYSKITEEEKLDLTGFENLILKISDNKYRNRTYIEDLDLYLYKHDERYVTLEFENYKLMTDLKLPDSFAEMVLRVKEHISIKPKHIIGKYNKGKL